jgi:hypothetical protein
MTTMDTQSVMTKEQFQEACDKFVAYLTANGLRPVAMIVHVVERDTAQQIIVRHGMIECLDNACLAVMASARGLEVRGL